MLPLHRALKVHHADTQRGPQKQELCLLGQWKVHALANKVTDLPGSSGKLRLHIGGVANRHADDGDTIAAVLHPQRGGQLSNWLLVAGKPLTAKDAGLVRSHIEAHTAQTVWSIAAEQPEGALHSSRSPHQRDIIKICSRRGSGFRCEQCLQAVLYGFAKQQGTPGSPWRTPRWDQMGSVPAGAPTTWRGVAVCNVTGLTPYNGSIYTGKHRLTGEQAR